MQGVGPRCYENCTVSVVDSDGRVRATATFPLPNRLSIGCQGGLVASPIQLAAGNVYYLAEGGAVHRLKPTGVDEVVATLPVLSSQQITWFAVSPDGARLMASIFSIPTLVPTSTCPLHAPGDLQTQLLSVTLGGATTTLRATKSPFVELKYPPPHILSIVGWDEVGPIAVQETHSGGMGSIEGTVWWGPAAHLDAQGKPGEPIGGPNCEPSFGALPDGRLVCFGSKQPTVRDRAGNHLWSLPPLDGNGDVTYGLMALSPDASKVAFVVNGGCCYTFDSSAIRGRDGAQVALGTAFQPRGWVDNQTIIGVQGTLNATCTDCSGKVFEPGELGVVRLAAPTRIEPLHLNGIFLGLVRSG